jgi:hypothetical protein
MTNDKPKQINFTYPIFIKFHSSIPEDINIATYGQWNENMMIEPMELIWKQEIKKQPKKNNPLKDMIQMDMFKNL